MFLPAQGNKDGLTTREITDRLAETFKDTAESKTVGAALCGMRNRGQVQNPAEGRWGLPREGRGGQA